MIKKPRNRKLNKEICFKRVASLLIALILILTNFSNYAVASTENSVSANATEVTSTTSEQADYPDYDSQDQEDEEQESIDDETAEEESSEDQSFSKTLVKETSSYKISVKIDDESVDSADTKLYVKKLAKDSDEYKDYIKKSARKMDVEVDDFSFAHAFDIHLEEDGEPIQPKKPVEVKIELLKEDVNSKTSNINIVHFGDKVEVVDSDVKKEAIKFSAESFSVYVVVDAPEPVHAISNNVLIDEINDEYSTEGFRLSVNRSSTDYYFTNNINTSLGYITENADINRGAPWFFEAVPGTEDQFYIYTKISGQKKYLKNTSGNLIGLVDSGGTAFALTAAGNDRFYIKTANANKWLQHSNSAGGIRLWTDKNNASNSKILLEPLTHHTMEDDPYGFDGKTYAIVNPKEEIKGCALMDEQITVGSTSRLNSKETLIRRDPMNQNKILEIVRDDSITEWEFENVERDLYYMKSAGKYIRVEGDQITLVTTPDEYCRIRVVPGTGARAGKVRLIGATSGSSISLNGTGFRALSTSNDTVWHNLATLSVYEDDDFTAYSAEKVGVSDGVNVINGSQVIIYTRIWDENQKKYRFYAVDHNGDLLECYESGDSIVWIGTLNNTLLWDFTEYYRPGTNQSNGYYELQNSYSGKYLAPQINGGQVLSDNKIGIQLNGRQDNDYYTTVLAWDDAYYDYAGLKAEGNKIVSCPMSQAQTFYFAVMHTNEDELTKIDTVDHISQGLTMKMVNFPSNDLQNAVLGNPQVGGNSKYITPGLLNTSIGSNSDGYPTATRTGRSLAELFANGQEVNNLFIQSIYNSSGYYQFDSTENFAHVITSTDDQWYGQDNGSGGTYDVGDFVVVQQLGGVSGTAGTRKHGQFMPYNTLDPTRAHANNPKNLYDIYAVELSDNDPRKYETLYALQEADDYYFGMEISGNFTMAPDGKDAWGHDSIFEFTGDDDFWLYVDGELLLDIGGIHQAYGGSVNYSTGEVVLRAPTSQSSPTTVTTTIYDIFKNNYATRNNLDPDDPAVTAYLDSIFTTKTVGGQPRRIFKDYSTHEIKIYYMERGAGASNLRMRFNLNTITPGQFLLSKEIAGTRKQDFASVKFPYQIYYDPGDGNGHRLLEQKMLGNTWQVVYKNTSRKVDYKESATIDGVTYNNVFFLKPGQTAEVNLPDETIDYYVKECGVNTDIYDEVYVNGDEVTGATPEGASNTKTYETTAESTAHRSKVVYENHVDEAALRTLTVTKKLFDESGNPLTAHDDNSEFTMRIRLGDNLDYYNQGEYFVRDPNGNYCYFNSQTGTFSSLGISNFSLLSPAQINRAKFITSPSGAVSKLPAGYSIEIRELLVGTKFRIDEEDYDIPVGYGKRTWTETEGGITKTYHGYKRVSGSYIISEGDTENSGTIRDNSNPHIEVHNVRGWGIRANKQWSDADFIMAHDDVYFAVYVDGVLLPDTIHKIDSYNYTTYFFPALEEGKTLSDYVVKEVELEDPVEQSDGSYTYTSITPLNENDRTTVGGIDSNGADAGDMDYIVAYQPGTMNGNKRTDTVTNSRIGGLKIVKVDESDVPLANAKFVLKKGSEILGNFTSNSSGLVTTAYLEDGIYTLSEISSPAGYKGLEDDIVISMNNGTPSFAGDQNFYTYNPLTGTLKVKNKPFTLKAVKIDAGTEEELEDAHFALYKQIKASNNTYRKDYYPIQGFEDLVTDSHGIIPNITQTLAAGTYYLSEIEAPEGYRKLNQDVLFTISPLGEVSLQSGQDYTGTLTSSGSNYTITIGNVIATPDSGLLNVTKHVTGNMGNKAHQFTFTITLTGDNVPEILTYVKGRQTGTINVVNGQAQFTLADSETVSFDNIPIGTQYAVTEDAEGYVSTSQNAQGTVSESGDVVFTNSRNVSVPTGISPHIWIAFLIAAGFIAVAVMAVWRRKMKAELLQQKQNKDDTEV